MNLTFKALSDPTRRKILELIKEKDLTAGQISDHFQISKPSISQHLNILKNAGLVQDEKKGQFVIYSLNTTVFEELIAWALHLTEKNGEM
jgi:DNA-binding transcriptional ArsR family regulator